MNKSKITILLVFLLVVITVSSINIQAGTGPFQNIVTTYNGYDLDKDGVKEIKSLSFFPSPFENPSVSIDLSKKLVVVIAETRLFSNISGSPKTADDLRQRIATLKSDLLREGRQAILLEMNPYDGPVQQDGKTLLAIREFFKSINNTFPNFEGALLIGAFPEASIVRTWPQDCVDNGEKQYRVGLTPGQPRRFELPLADLNGNWRNIYHESANLDGYIFHVTTSTTVAQKGTQITLTNPKIERTTESLKDVFWIQDAVYQVSNPAGSTPIVNINLACADPEVSTQDKLKPNPIAQPDICVSRINARSIAVQPPNARLLDANGKPQQTQDAPPISFGMEDWQRDPKLERTLLINYFDKNHAFRAGMFSEQGFGISVLESAGLGTSAADEGLSGLNGTKDQVNEATLLDFIRWLKKPAIFRAISAHADSHSTELIQENDQTALQAENEAGGHPWRWIGENGKYVPSFKGHYTGDLYVYRTLWENNQLANLPPSLMIHVGCDVNSVDHPEQSYTGPWYGTFQNAEGLLFYANQLAIICRTTWWNRGPMGFGDSFGASNSAVFGDGWKGVSAKISQDSGLAQQSTERKQSYIWSIVGDWTLQKYYPTWPYAQKINNADSTPKALAATVFQNKLFAFWKANDTDNRIYCSASVDGTTWSNGHKINTVDSTPEAVSVCVFQNKLYAFWKSNDSGNKIYYSASADGVTWPNGKVINTGDATPKSVSVCVFQDKLFVFWKANDTDNRIYCSASVNGITWPNGHKINTADSTPEAVSVSVFQNKLCVFWKANDKDNRIYCSGSIDGITWPNGHKINDFDSTPLAPVACVFNNRQYLFWKANDSGNRIYCSSSSDGISWPNGHQINDFDTTPQPLASCVFNNQLYVFWKSNDSGNRIYYSRNDMGHRM